MPTVEFGTKDTADDVREQYKEHLCSDDDRRLKTVTFSGDTPDDVLDRVTVRAARTRSDRDGAGQRPLDEHERDRIDFSKPRASVPHARAVKAIATDHGVDDWTAHYDGTLTVDEHREVMQQAARDDRGQRMDSEPSVDERLGRTEAAVNQQCDHARDACKLDEPEACEFLRERCGFDEEEIDALMADTEETVVLQGIREDDDPIRVSPETAGAVKSAWSTYQVAVNRFDRLLSELRDEWETAQRAARTVNRVRTEHDQEPIHFDRLEDGQADLTDLLRKVASDCSECHADHSDHDHPVSGGEREDVREFADEGRAETPVGSGGDRGDDPTSEVNA